MLRNSVYLFGLGFLSVLSAIYQGVAYWHGAEPSDRLVDLWDALFVLLLVLWIDADSRTQPQITRPFEYGWLVLLFWIPYTPYYFWRTRGAKGLLMFAGIACLFFSGWFVRWLIYLAR